MQKGQTRKIKRRKQIRKKHPARKSRRNPKTWQRTEKMRRSHPGRKPDLSRIRQDSAKTIARHLPAWVVSRIPFLADAVNIPTDTPISVEKDFVKRYQAPHCQEIVGDLLYDTDTSEMFLRKESSYGFDRPCIHFNYRSQNGHFFCCSVRYDRHDKNGHGRAAPDGHGNGSKADAPPVSGIIQTVF